MTMFKIVNYFFIFAVSVFLIYLIYLNIKDFFKYRKFDLKLLKYEFKLFVCISFYIFLISNLLMFLIYKIGFFLNKFKYSVEVKLIYVGLICVFIIIYFLISFLIFEKLNNKFLEKK